MKLRWIVLEITALAVVGLVVSVSLAADGSTSGRSCLSTGPVRNCPSSAFCPDDYCRKPAPRVPCPAWSCNPECFVRKPLPCPPRSFGCATCDDYVPKSFPQEPCPFRPYPLSSEACSKARWYEQPFSGRSTGISLLRK